MVLKSQIPGLAIPAVSLAEYVLGDAEKARQGVAIIEGHTGYALDYARLRELSEATAAAIAAKDYRPGAVIGIMSPNRADFAIAYYGILLSVCVVTTISPLATAADLINQLHDSGAVALFVSPELEQSARAAAEALKLQDVFAFGDVPHTISLQALYSSGLSLQKNRIDPDALALLAYSSGTTGRSKCVMLSHRNLVANVSQVAAMQRIDDCDRIFAIMPFGHIYGMNVVLNLGLHCGATLIVYPRFELNTFLDSVERYRITRAFLAPPAMVLLAKHPSIDDRDLSSLRVIVSGGATLDQRLQIACAERLQCHVFQGYGLTEASPVTHFSCETPLRSKPGSGGLLVRWTEALIVDAVTGSPLGANKDGEIWVRGPQVMQGYLNDPNSTSASLDADGWLRTGDIGHVDDEGFVFIVDRLKELIKYKGYQVPPAELEALLLTHPAIADAAVIGIPDEAAGELPKALVVRSRDVTEAEIISFVGSQVAPYKKIRIVEFIDEIPKSPSGKILRRLLKDREKVRSH